MAHAHDRLCLAGLGGGTQCFFLRTLAGKKTFNCYLIGYVYT
jgi:hypothetical protein